MADILADASSIIVIARLGGIEMVYSVLGRVGLTKTVWKESVETGRKLGYADAEAIERGSRQGFVEMVEPVASEVQMVDELVSSSPAYHRGECETIICAETRQLSVLIEERRGRSLARARGLPYTILQAVPLRGYIEEQLSFEDAEEWLERIAAAMNTDLAVLHALKSALLALNDERRKSRS